MGEAISRRQIETISQRVLDYNKGYTKGVSFNDFIENHEVKPKLDKGKKRKNAKSSTFSTEIDDEVPITTTKGLRNIYDEGYLSNLWDICFPRRIR